MKIGILESGKNNSVNGTEELMVVVYIKVAGCLKLTVILKVRDRRHFPVSGPCDVFTSLPRRTKLT